MSAFDEAMGATDANASEPGLGTRLLASADDPFAAGNARLDDEAQITAKAAEDKRIKLAEKLRREEEEGLPRDCDGPPATNGESAAYREFADNKRAEDEVFPPLRPSPHHHRVEPSSESSPFPTTTAPLSRSLYHHLASTPAV